MNQREILILAGLGVLAYFLISRMGSTANAATQQIPDVHVTPGLFSSGNYPAMVDYGTGIDPLSYD